MCKDEHKSGRGCHCRRALLRGFVQPHLLFQLSREPAHGYELLETLESIGDVASADPGNLYRILRKLEEEGLVHSGWDTSGTGPARRVYEITEKGVEHLDAWVVNLRKTRLQLDRFLAAYDEHVPTSS